jgi:hypothetical protein
MKMCGCKPPYIEPNIHHGELVVTDVNALLRRLYSKFYTLERKVEYLENNCCSGNQKPDIPDDSNTDEEFEFNVTTNVEHDDDIIIVSADVQELVFKLTANKDCTWKVVANNLLTISPSTGEYKVNSKTQEITVSIPANDAHIDDTYTIRFYGTNGDDTIVKTFQIVQNAKELQESIDITPSVIVFEDGSSKASVIVTMSAESYTTKIKEGSDYSDYYVSEIDETGTNLDGTTWVRIKYYSNKDNITGSDIKVVITYTAGSVSKDLSLIFKDVSDEDGEDTTEILDLDPESIIFTEDKAAYVTVTHKGDFKYTYNGTDFAFVTESVTNNPDGTVSTVLKVSPILYDTIDNYGVTAVIPFEVDGTIKYLTLTNNISKVETPTDPDNGDNSDTGDSGDNGDTEDNTGGDNNNGDDNSSSTTTPTNMWIKVAASELEFDYTKGSQNTVEVTYSHPDLKRHLNIDTSKFNYYEEDVTTNSDGSITRRYTITTMSENTTGKDITDTFGFDYWYYSYINACTNLTQKPKTTTDTTVTPTTKYSYFKSNDTVAASAINLTESSIKQWTKVTNSLTSNDDTSINIEDTVYETEGNYFFGVAIPSSWSIKFINNTSKQDEIDIMSTATINITDPHDDGSSDVVEYTVYYFEGHPTIRGDETFTIKITN